MCCRNQWSETSAAARSRGVARALPAQKQTRTIAVHLCGANEGVTFLSVFISIPIYLLVKLILIPKVEMETVQTVTNARLINSI